ncbi:metallophosphoesterase [Novispirillum itersonii]|uniref:Calcineurin-like phosphoesterase domain-containing protein n=1 Tax=Novispirillum itersonii TaxID=189 RepID=A0A7W9ZDJ3_NOVIT|nr:metallophosphoesterase [Novispirillum itersonii]MBB6209527.1 hypothetical protein [Novispirillum itersonii]
MRGMMKAAVVAMMIAGTGTPASAADAFSFVAIGDMPYGKPEEAYPPYERLIAAINAANPDFTVHIGDIKSGSTVCSDEEFRNQLGFLNSFKTALLYTPGDNEWTDCHRKKAGSMDPLERLDALRRLFFTKAETLGKAPLKVERQADVSAHKQMVENARFTHKGVMVVTAHVVGSNNNFEVRDPAAVAEFFARDAANVEWIRSSFAKAKAENARVLVLAMQANPLDSDVNGETPGHSGFNRTLDAFAEEAAAFGKPVLFIHGDTHYFRIDHPFKTRDKDKKVLDNVTRLEVYGEKQVHAVKVSIDPDSEDTFSFRPLYVKGQRDFVKN